MSTPTVVLPEQVAEGQCQGSPQAQLGDCYGFVGFKGVAQMLRIHRDAKGHCTSLEAGVDHRLDGVALGF